MGAVGLTRVRKVVGVRYGRSLSHLLILTVVLSAFPLHMPDARATDHLVLRVGGQDEMKTRNLLPSIANDVWTADVLFRVYEGVLLTHPTAGRPMAWIAKGVDFDEDGIFEPATEYDAWEERATATTPLQITVYYDFNGVRWHDGTQMTLWDLFFSYHVNAMNSLFNTDLRVLFPDPIGYEAGNRQLTIALAPKSWSGEGQLPGDATLRVAIRFTLSQRFALFYESTLAPVMMPMHVWSRTGGARHTDFGCAIWIPPAEATARGIPECGNPDPARHGMGIATTETVMGSTPYHYSSAEAWSLTDGDVIGHGPFEFDRWVPGVQANLVRNEDFYTGGGPGTSQAWDDRLVRLLRKPTITEIEFMVYKTTQLGVFALLSGEIDFYHWNVGAEFVPDLLKHWEIGVESNAEPGYFYMGYNMRDAPWGYENFDPTKDVGFGLRQAISHLVDKKSIVQNLLQNFGVIANGFISPANTFWYNDDIPKPRFDLAAANAILDDLATPAGDYYDPRFTLDPPGLCHKDNDAGCRSLPVIANVEFEILTPQADYDPIRASAGAMIADAMRQVGINAGSRPTSFGEVVSRITIHDFDLFILGWRITGTDPDYLFSFFHCGNAFGNGLGYCSPEFDQVIDASRAEMDRGVRQGLIYRAQEILARDRPAEPLYYRTNIEAYRQDGFVNWTVASGTIWNFWSLIGIHPPTSGPYTIAMALDAPTAMMAEDTVPLEFQIRDPLGEPVPNAQIEVNVTSGPSEDPGILRGDGQEGAQIRIRTNAAGGATAEYTAPRFFEGARQVVVSATASHPDYEGVAQEMTILTVLGPDLTFLRVDIDLPLGDVARPGVPVPMVIDLRDRWGVVHDAHVVVEATPAGQVSPSTGLSQDVHLATVTFPSPGIYTLGLSATKGGHRDAWAVATVWVVEETPPPPLNLPPTVLPDGFPIAAFAVFLAATAASAIAAAVFRRIRTGARRR